MMVTTEGRNGVNVDQLVSTVQAVQQDPNLASFTFKACTVWCGGGRSETRVDEYVHAGAAQDRGTSFTLGGDEPPVLLGSNTAPNAVEAVLAALASCYAVGFAYNAAARGIDIEELRFELEGDLDLHGFLGLSPNVRPGFNTLRCTIHLKSDADPTALQELSEHVQRTSPVLDIIRNPVPVETRLITA